MHTCKICKFKLFKLQLVKTPASFCFFPFDAHFLMSGSMKVAVGTFQDQAKSNVREEARELKMLIKPHSETAMC